MYVLLLGFAFGAEYSLLRLGRDLQAAPVVRGEWRLRAGEADRPCFSTTTMSIAQSGADVEIMLAGAPKLTGTIAGTQLHATASGRGDVAAGCAPVAVLSELSDRSMRGSLQLLRGAPIPFTATRTTADGQ
jgi:hypothetical protein